MDTSTKAKRMILDGKRLITVFRGVSERLNTDGEARGRPPNLHDPQMLDIASSSHWNTLRHRTDSITDGRGFDGVLMCMSTSTPVSLLNQLTIF